MIRQKNKVIIFICFFIIIFLNNIYTIHATSNTKLDPKLTEHQNKKKFPNNHYIVIDEPDYHYPKHLKALQQSLNYYEDWYKVFMRWTMNYNAPGNKKMLATAYNQNGNILPIIYVKFDKMFPKLTDRPLDFFVKGKSNFFNVKTKEGKIFYTHDGRFKRLKNGQLVTIANSYSVLGENGPIFLPNQNFSVTSKGDIFDGETFVDRFKITGFDSTDGLWSYDTVNFFVLHPNLSKPLKNPDVDILQGYIEMSNSQPGLFTTANFRFHHEPVARATKVYMQSYQPMFRAVSSEN